MHTFTAPLLGLVIYLLMTSTVSAADEHPRLKIQGTFIQLLGEHREWPPAKWQSLFTQFKALGLSRLVVQWSAYDDIAFFQTSEYQGISPPPLETILSLADAAGMELFVGLHHHSEFWNKVALDANLVEVYLQRSRHHSTLLAERLEPLLKKHPSFQGWYIPQEVDDINWQTPNKRKVLFTYLNSLATQLHLMTPKKQVAISGFSNAAMDPETFEEFWSALLQAAPIDVVLFQDGIGVNKLKLKELPLYLKAMHDATSTNVRELQIVIEIFSQTEGPPLDNNAFRAVPAPLERITKQLRIAGQYSEKNIAFSVPEYMSQQGSAEARKLYERYLSYLLLLAQ